MFFCIYVILQRKEYTKNISNYGKNTEFTTFKVYMENKLDTVTLYLRLYGVQIIGLSKCHWVTGAVTVLFVL